MPTTAVTNASLTVTDDERTLWEGTFAEFAGWNEDGLDADELRILLDTGHLDIGGGAAPLLHVVVSP